LAADRTILEDEALAERVILDLCAAHGLERTCCPTDVAKACSNELGEPQDGWRARLSTVRRVAIRLAQADRIAIYRKGKPVDPNAFKGVYRLGLRR
jgi:hypothetical protein